MQRLLLCLLSEQHVPNLLSVHHIQPDGLVLVESAAMRKRNVAAHFLHALKLGGLDYDARHTIEPLEAEDSLEAVRRTLQQAYDKHPSAEWIANLTGGTKPMSIATYEFFKERKGRLIYTNVTRPAVLLDIVTEKTETCQHRLGIKEFLAGYGFESRKADDKIQQAEERARQQWECSRIIAANASAETLLQLSDEERQRSRSKGWDLQPGQLSCPDPRMRESIATTFGLTQDNTGSLMGRLSNHAAQFLTGGWLEVFFWGLISRHANELNVWDVRLGLEVGRAGDSSGNDFDVAFMRNYALEMMECKSGAQSHDTGGDVLYKVEAVTRQFRALRVRSYLATTGTNVLDSEGKIKRNLQNRADIYGCRILTSHQLRELAERADDPGLVRKVLFGDQASGVG